MSKVLVDRELLELLRNFTFLHDDGCAGALRGGIDRAIAQPAEAEGAVAQLRRVIDELKAGFVVCQQCGDQEDTATLDCVPELEAIAAALSAVTAERDAIAGRLAEWERSTLVRENVELTAERDRLRPIHAMILNALDRDAEEGKTARGEMAAELRAALAAKEA